MAITALSLLTEAAGLLNDASFVRYSKPTLLGFLNSAQLQVVLVRPDANSVIEAIQLVPGTRQSIPATGLRLLDAIRNMGANGATPGKSVLVGHRNAQDTIRGWHTKATSTVVNDVFFDDRVAKQFYVDAVIPNAPSAVWLEIAYSKAPVVMTNADTESIELSDVYYGPLLDWVMHKAYAKNTQSQIARARSNEFRTSFYAALGVKLKMDVAESPNVEAFNG